MSKNVFVSSAHARKLCLFLAETHLNILTYLFLTCRQGYCILSYLELNVMVRYLSGSSLPLGWRRMTSML